MSSIHGVTPIAPAPAPSRAAVAAAPKAQAVPIDTVTVSPAGRAASQGYLQSALQLAQDPPQQVAPLAAAGNAQARAALAREAYSRILFS